MRKLHSEKPLLYLIFFLMITLVFGPVNLTHADETVTDYVYERLDNTSIIINDSDSLPFDYEIRTNHETGEQFVEIRGYTGTEQALVIPETIEDLPVERISHGALSDNSVITSVVVPDTVITIDSNAFRDCENLESVTIGAGLTHLGGSVFAGSRNLISVTFSGNQLESIGNFAFLDCESLESIVLPDSVTTMGVGIFRRCSSLRSAILPANLSTISSDLFNGCSSLESIVIPAPVQTIGDSAFYECAALSSVTLPSGIVSIESQAFRGCRSLEEIHLPNSLTTIAVGSFMETGLKHITIPDQLTRIESSTFSDCSDLESVMLGSNVTSIGGRAFFNCSQITSINMPDSVTLIENDAFGGCTALTSIDLSSELITMGNSVFANCTSLKDIDIPDKVTSIGTAAFFGCTSLTSVDLPENLTVINQNLFSGCTSLQEVSLGLNVTHIGTGSFQNSGITTLSLPDSLVEIGMDSFRDCGSLDTITIPGLVETVGHRAFYNAPSLQSAYFLGDAPEMGDFVFYLNHPDFKVYYYQGATGFTTPTWQGNPSVEIDETVAPTISQKSVERTDPHTALVVFTSSHSGSYFYEAVEKGADQPVLDVSGEGHACIVGDNQISLAGLTPGEKDLYVQVRSELGSLSNLLKIDIPTSMHQLTYTSGPGGTVTGETSQTVSYGNSGSPVEAIPDPGYVFTGWSDGILVNPRIDENITGDIDVTAHFSMKGYRVLYLTSGDGFIEGNADQTVFHGQDGSAVKAVANAGSEFWEWSDGETNPERQERNVSEDMTITAVFRTHRTLHVKQTATGSEDGTSWANAFTDLQDALGEARKGDQIWVAKGVYYPAADASDRHATFRMKDGVSLYGGFVGGESSLTQRDWKANPTVLSGDLDRNDNTNAEGVVTAPTNIAGNNAYTVVSAVDVGADTTLDGFVITAGKSDGEQSDPLEYWFGGGIYLENASPVLQNLKITGCYGGGIYASESDPSLTDVAIKSNHGIGMYNDHSSPSLTRVLFEANTGIDQNNSGGGMLNISSNPSLYQVDFIRNGDFFARSPGYGGGMANSQSSPTLVNVSFKGNYSYWEGGGVRNTGNSHPTLTNVLISGNATGQRGGGMYNSSSSPEMINVTFSKNYSGVFGGALFNRNNSNPTLTNSIIWNHMASMQPAYNIMWNDNATPVFSHSIIKDSGGSTNWNSYFGTDGGNNWEIDPGFVHETVGYSNTGSTTGDYRLKPDSPAINAGDNNVVTSTTDLDGNPRIDDGIVDLGPYEYQSKPDTLAVVANTAQLNTALANPSITTVRFSSSITANINTDRLVNLDFDNHILTGNITFNTFDAGGMILDGSAEPSITGDLTVYAPNASVVNNVKVGGTIFIQDVADSTWEENADGNDLVIDLQSGTDTVIINGNVNTLMVNSSGDGLNLIINGSVERAEFNAPSEVTGAGNIQSALINSEDVNLDEDPAHIEKPVPIEEPISEPDPPTERERSGRRTSALPMPVSDEEEIPYITADPEDDEMDPVESTTILLFIDSNVGMVNDQELIMDVAPFINEEVGRTMIPVKFIAESLGAEVHWLPETRQVRIHHDKAEVLLTIDSSEAMVNETMVQFPTPSVIIDNRAFVPLRSFCEVLEAIVSWDENERSITIKQ